jgi:glycogen synthase
MRILMLGWEFAPFITGGLGRACEKIVDELLDLGHSVDFAVPMGVGNESRDRFRLIALNDSQKNSYCGSSFPLPYSIHSPSESSNSNPYAGHLLEAVENYTNQIFEKFSNDQIDRSRENQYDAIHAHDWLTFTAAQVLSKKLQIPFIAHFHSLESDRNPKAPNAIVVAIEKMAVEKADVVIAVSEFTRQCLKKHYGLSDQRSRVVYNGTDTFLAGSSLEARASAEKKRSSRSGSSAQTVLFMGRLTHQKGVQQFCSIAGEVLKTAMDTKFVVAGEGDMELELKNSIKAHGLEDSFSLVGMLEGREVNEAYENADVLMMPSVSEPFGLVATEATEHGLPSVLSTASGAVEIMPHAFKASPDDPVRFARLINLLLANPEIGQSVVHQSQSDMAQHTWRKTATLISNSYAEAIRQ